MLLKPQLLDHSQRVHTLMLKLVEQHGLTLDQQLQIHIRQVQFRRQVSRMPVTRLRLGLRLGLERFPHYEMPFHGPQP